MAQETVPRDAILQETVTRETVAQDTTWQCGDFAFPVQGPDAHPLVMGILNVTPDSFSDGGTHNAPADALAYAELMLEQGADIIDVGGESTRPGSDEVLPDEEARRVLPVVRELVRRGVCVSVDTRHAQVARACVEAGAANINDVSGFRDPDMVDVAAGCEAGLVVMHMLGEPKTMQAEPRYDDVVAEVSAYLVRQARMLESAGVAHNRICIDPGVGFGKTTDHNLKLLKATDRLAALGYPLMVAVSRKRFIGALTDVDDAAQRVAGSVAAAAYAVEHGAVVARVHDVAQTAQAFRLFAAILSA